MKHKIRGVGKKMKRNKDILTRANEFSEKASDHFSKLFLQRLKNVREVRLWVAEWALLVLVVFLLAVVQIFWYGSSYQTTAFVDGGDFTEASFGEVKSMNPLYATTNSEKNLSKLLFANLVAPDNSGHIGMELAESVTHDESGKIWTVKLRDGLRWSDGEPITAEDILYSIKVIDDKDAKTTVAVDFSKAKIEKIDDKTVKFSLPSVYADFLSSLDFALLPAHILREVSPALVYEHDFSSHPVGSGPFVLKAVQNAGANDAFKQVIYLSRNEKYFGGKTRLDNFNLRTYDKVEKIVDALRTQTVDASAEEIEEEKLPQSLNNRSVLTNGGVFAFLNIKSSVLQEVAVRRAIQQGVDMAKVREGIDEMRKMDYPILSTQEDLTFPELKKYDFEGAKKALTEAKLHYDEDGKLYGESTEPISLTIAVRKREPILGVAKRFADELTKLGFTVVVNAFDDTQPGMDFFASVLKPRDYDILFYEVDLGAKADPFVYFNSTQASESGWNFSNYNNALVDDALLTARTTMDVKLRRSKYEAFLKRWVSDVPAIGIMQSVTNYHYRDGVGIFSENAKFTDAFDRYEDVKYWTSKTGEVMQTP